jgi:hypothetical protein
MITTEPAWMLGIEKRVGAIEPGMDADLAIFNAPPFSALSARGDDCDLNHKMAVTASLCFRSDSAPPLLPESGEAEPWRCSGYIPRRFDGPGAL